MKAARFVFGEFFWFVGAVLIPCASVLSCMLKLLKRLYLPRGGIYVFSLYRVPLGVRTPWRITNKRRPGSYRSGRKCEENNKILNVINPTFSLQSQLKKKIMEMKDQRHSSSLPQPRLVWRWSAPSRSPRESCSPCVVVRCRSVGVWLIAAPAANQSAMLARWPDSSPRDRRGCASARLGIYSLLWAFARAECHFQFNPWSSWATLIKW